MKKPHPDDILVVAMDAHNCFGMNEAMIDTWWRSLTREDKAAIYADSLEADSEPVSISTCGIAPAALRNPSFTNAIAELGRAVVARGVRP